MPNAVVVVGQGQSVDGAIRKLKKQVTQSRIQQNTKNRAYYMSKGEQRRKKALQQKGKIKRAKEQKEKEIYDGSRNHRNRSNTNR